MSWLLLALAIVTEVTGTIALKYSQGFSALKPSAVVVVAYVTSFSLLGLSLKGIELGIAYAIWSGVGNALVAIAGIFLFDETVTVIKTVAIAPIVIGVVGLNLAGRAAGA
ncbi:MAG: multidrug efflux SMR transporter [Rhodospirillaceae bacterium]